MTKNLPIKTLDLFLCQMTDMARHSGQARSSVEYYGLFTEEEFCVEIRLFVLIMSAPAVALCPQAIRPRSAVSTQNSSPGNEGGGGEPQKQTQ